MKRTAGALVLLAALGGCRTTDDPEGIAVSCLHCKPQLAPSPSPVWKQAESTGRTYPESVLSANTRALQTGQNIPGAMPRPNVAVAPVPPGLKATSSLPAPVVSTFAAAPVTPPASVSANALASASPIALAGASSTSGTTSRTSSLAETTVLSDLLAPSTKATVSTPRTEKTSELPASPASATAAASANTSSTASQTTASQPKTNSPSLASAATIPSRSSDRSESRSSGPAVHLVNSKRINLNYEVNDVGPSGISAVELWYTQDSRTWKRYEGLAPTRPPFVAEVGDEGVYGFTLVAKNGHGVGRGAPQPGDVPQVWVEIDMTKPVVNLQSVEPGFDGKPGCVLIRWTVSDKNLGPRPVTLAYAESDKGPWIPIAANVDNTGRYIWHTTAATPGRFSIRVEASDLAGNVASAQTPHPIFIDMEQPSVSIMGVEPLTK